MRTVEGIMKQNNILKDTVCNTSALHAARAAQASTGTRDSMFTKLENYIDPLHELGIFREKSYSEIKSSQIYNMDKCALDTTRQKKVLHSKEEICCLFQITPEGDRMNIHISIALTSRANGKF